MSAVPEVMVFKELSRRAVVVGQEGLREQVAGAGMEVQPAVEVEVVRAVALRVPQALAVVAQVVHWALVAQVVQMPTILAPVAPAPVAVRQDQHQQEQTAAPAATTPQVQEAALAVQAGQLLV